MDTVGFQFALPSRRPCPFYQHGLCLLGDDCKLSHAAPDLLAGGEHRQATAKPGLKASSRTALNEELKDSRDGGPDFNASYFDGMWSLDQGHTVTAKVCRDELLSERVDGPQFDSTIDNAWSNGETASAANFKLRSSGNYHDTYIHNGWDGNSTGPSYSQTNSSDFQQSIHPFNRYGVGTLPRVREHSSVMQPVSSLPGFGRGRGLIMGGSGHYQPLRRPGRDAADRVGKSFFCHQCKQDIPMIRTDLACPLCLGDFIEESTTVERPNPQPSALAFISQKQEPAKDGFAWIPPAHLYQAFLRKEDKLVDLAGSNPYLYLEDEDALDDDFPCLDSPLPPVLDERIAAKEKSKSRLSSFAGSLPENESSSCDHDDEKNNEEDSGEEIEKAAPLPENKKLSRGQKRRRRKEARRVALKIRKIKDKAEITRKEMAKKEYKEAMDKAKAEERRNRAKVRSMQELESKIIKMKLAQNLQQV